MRRGRRGGDEHRVDPDHPKTVKFESAPRRKCQGGKGEWRKRGLWTNSPALPRMKSRCVVTHTVKTTKAMHAGTTVKKNWAGHGVSESIGKFERPWVRERCPIRGASGLHSLLSFSRRVGARTAGKGTRRIWLSAPCRQSRMAEDPQRSACRRGLFFDH